MDAISNVQQWRVTEDNPATSGEEMDSERCAALHNHIVELGWVGGGRDLETLERRTWWEQYGQDAEDIRIRLAPSLVNFLKRAYVGPEDEIWSWHYYLSGLMDPESFFEAPNDLDDEYEEDRFIWLYLYGRPLGHTNGLIFDQVDMAAIVQPTIEDSDVTMNGRQSWQPLEHILDAYIDMIEHGKIYATPDDSGYQGPPDRQRPWVIRPYSDYILERTITAFNNLAAAIQERAERLENDDQNQLLADERTLDRARITGFAREFLLKTKRPAFKYIAPGIAIQTAEELLNQPYSDISPENEGDIGPILLFRSDRPAMDLADIFIAPFDGTHCCIPGLYIVPYSYGDSNPFPDATRFLLPFPIGANGFAKSSDGGLIGERRDSKSEPEGEDLHHGLYTTGYNPYIEEHDTQLYRILEHWTDMVKQGHWKVDQTGVLEVIEKFRDADTEEHCEDYMILQDW